MESVYNGFATPSSSRAEYPTALIPAVMLEQEDRRDGPRNVRKDA